MNSFDSIAWQAGLANVDPAAFRHAVATASKAKHRIFYTSGGLITGSRADYGELSTSVELPYSVIKSLAKALGDEELRAQAKVLA